MRQRLASLAVVAVAAGAIASGPAHGVRDDQPVAPGGPGALSHFGHARKDCVGTARNTTSKVWFTVADGVLSDVYYPTIDNTNVENLQFLVTDGSSFTDLQTRDTAYQVQPLDETGMSCRVTSSPANGRYQLITDYLTDPARNSVVMRVRLVPRENEDLRLYVRFDANVNGNGGGGAQNGGADDASVDSASSALVSSDRDPTTNAVNRDYGEPVYAALKADRDFIETSSGYTGTDSDGLMRLDADRHLNTAYTNATNGNVVQTARVDLDGGGGATLALGFASTYADSIATAGGTLSDGFDRVYHDYAEGWRGYDDSLTRAPDPTALGMSDTQASQARAMYWVSANVLKASEDKTYPGAIVASLASPWGQAVSAGDTPDGKAVYFGSYREIFGRDLYEAATGLLAMGDPATARDAVRFLFERQQLPDGRFPRNSLINGKLAPDTGGDELDETAYPIVIALQAGLADDDDLWPRVRKAADFLVSHGPEFGVERWEERGGYSPSTIASEIAGLVAAAEIADQHGDAASARVYRATADHFQRGVKGWTVTTNGPYADGRYFIRLSMTGDPNSPVVYHLGNGSVDVDQRQVIDAGFLELSRLGIFPADDPDIIRSLRVVDQVIRRDTPVGTGFYRYGTADPGTEDGYGDCYEPDPTACQPSGKPWPTGGTGSGHLWPLLSGERAEHYLAVGDRDAAKRLFSSMTGFSWGVGLVPEQNWENPELPKSAAGTDPATASIGYTRGGAAGSATPLVWAQAQRLRLMTSLSAGRVVERPDVVAARYLNGGPPGHAPMSLSAPHGGVDTGRKVTTVAGKTDPGATVDVEAVDTTGDVDTGTIKPGAVPAKYGPGVTATKTVTADSHGHFSVELPTPKGTSAITVVATGTDGATGYARVGAATSTTRGKPAAGCHCRKDPHSSAGGHHGGHRRPAASTDRFAQSRHVAGPGSEVTSEVGRSNPERTGRSLAAPAAGTAQRASGRPAARPARPWAALRADHR